MCGSGCVDASRTKNQIVNIQVMKRVFSKFLEQKRTSKTIILDSIFFRRNRMTIAMIFSIVGMHILACMLTRAIPDGGLGAMTCGSSATSQKRQ